MYKKLDESIYENLIDGIKEINREKKLIISSSEYKIGASIIRKKHKLKDDGIKGFIKIVNDYIKFKKGESYSMAQSIFIDKDYGISNYFLDERIAIYTCITGKYDTIVEPIFVPDNCDYYAVTDSTIQSDSKWKRIDISSLNIPKADRLMIESSPILANRYFKIKPHILFPNYKYSVYVDGNIRICTDMTEYVNRLSNLGVGTFCHSQRFCVYEEAKACVAMGKDTQKNIENHLRHLEEEMMPHNYGMAQCSIIVREHNSALCMKLMNDWWYEFVCYSNRDQLSFPFVAYKNGIAMDEITTLGGNLYASDSFEIIPHKNR